MDRRKSLKTIVLGSVATGLAANGCKPGEETLNEIDSGHKPVAWRTDYENDVLTEIKDGKDFFNAHERETMIALCDLILPPSEQYKGASDADVVSFIDFMARDTESEQMQTDLKGGLMWLDHKCNTETGVEFKSATETQQKDILEKDFIFTKDEISKKL